MNSSSHIQVRDLNVYYGTAHALQHITVDIPDKAITCIIGPSGCGKTTLLRSFNRLIDSVDGVHVTGEILVDGENILAPDAELTHIRQKMGLLSQRPFPLPMSIYENVAFGPRLHGVRDKKTLDTIVEQRLIQAHLWTEVKDRLNSPASRLSIGQQQRLCLARGLAVQPAILLGDEPTSALDPISSRFIEEKFMELRSELSIVLVTHILRQARRLADYVLFMYMGELIEHSTAKEFFSNPKHDLSKQYLGGEIS